MQDSQSSKFVEKEELLMECWSDNAATVNTVHILNFAMPLHELRKYSDGDYIIREGEVCTCVFHIVDGEAIVTRVLNDQDSDDEEREEVSLYKKLLRLMC